MSDTTTDAETTALKANLRAVTKQLNRMKAVHCDALLAVQKMKEQSALDHDFADTQKKRIAERDCCISDLIKQVNEKDATIAAYKEALNNIVDKASGDQYEDICRIYNRARLTLDQNENAGQELLDKHKQELAEKDATIQKLQKRIATPSPICTYSPNLEKRLEKAEAVCIYMIEQMYARIPLEAPMTCIVRKQDWDQVFRYIHEWKMVKDA